MGCEAVGCEAVRCEAVGCEAVGCEAVGCEAVGCTFQVALDDKKRVFTWGFGGYGRLGHAEPKSEWVPRMVKFFEGPSRGARRLAAGSTFTLIINEHGTPHVSTF